MLHTSMLCVGGEGGGDTQLLHACKRHQQLLAGRVLGDACV